MDTTLLACRWNWCTRTFSDHVSLQEHVLCDHLPNATPVKRKDVPLLRLVETGASLPESSLTKYVVSDTDCSQALPLRPNYVQRGVMTDPIEVQVSTISGSSDIPGASPDLRITPMQSPRPSIQGSQLPVKFVEMCGTPSPAPSLIPPSPGTAYLVRKMTQNSPFPVSPRRSPHASSRASRNHQNTSLDLSPSTTRARDLTSCPIISVLAETDHTDPKDTNVAAGAEASPSSQDVVESQLMIMDGTDSLHEMDIHSVLFPGLDSQWQPQSQLPLHDSFDTSSLPSTVNPSQLHADNVE